MNIETTKEATNVELSNRNQSKRPPRDDPFGQRYLRDEDAVFDYNAWDDVDWSEDREIEIQQTLQSHLASRVSEEEVQELLKTPEQSWDAFYETHSNKFFMDRKWLTREFPELFQKVEIRMIRFYSF